MKCRNGGEMKHRWLCPGHRNNIRSLHSCRWQSPASFAHRGACAPAIPIYLQSYHERKIRRSPESEPAERPATVRRRLFRRTANPQWTVGPRRAATQLSCVFVFVPTWDKRNCQSLQKPAVPLQSGRPGQACSLQGGGFQGVDDNGRIFKPRGATAHGQPHQTTDISTSSGQVRARSFLHVAA